MTRMWRLIALVALLLGIAGMLRLYHVGFVWRNGLSLETTVVLFVGLLAFLAVMVQVEAERNARAEEAERRKRAVATAILFEIDNFYHHHLGQVRDLLAAYARSQPLPTTLPAPAHGFVVYHENASRLGDLPRELAGEIVRFYGMAEHYDVVKEDYRGRVESQSPEDQGIARTQFRQLRNFISKLELSAYELSKHLCLYLDLRFDPSVVEIAGTDVKTLEAEVATLDRLQAAAVQQISTYAKKD